MKAEPLKGKVNKPCNCISRKTELVATKEEIASAVEWLKESLKKTMKHQKEVKGNIWDYTVVGDLIDKAFEDVVKKGDDKNGN